MIHFSRNPFSPCVAGEIHLSFPLYTSSIVCVGCGRSERIYCKPERMARELASGKMFGVLIVQTDNGITNNEENQIDLSCSFLRQSGRKESASLFRSSCL